MKQSCIVYAVDKKKTANNEVKTQIQAKHPHFYFYPILILCFLCRRCVIVDARCCWLIVEVKKSIIYRVSERARNRNERNSARLFLYLTRIDKYTAVRSHSTHTQAPVTGGD